ncbi:MAG: phosphate ABC transporter ATPase [Chloroflexi bacterium OLB15]|nr:MAG: phosphate ABC transporter ATPase [Chloroflexi bacterium OLB15]
MADMTAFFSIRKEVQDSGKDKRWGVLVEYAPTTQIFEHPQFEETERYISGEFG